MKGEKEPFRRIADYYDSLVERHGHHPKACDYGTARSQKIKFEVLAEVMLLRGRKVLDVGCGFADFADFLKVKHGRVHYVGVDLSSKMIQQGKRLYPKLDLRRGNVFKDDLGQFDVVVANGIFYLLGRNAELLMKRAIRRMFASCTRALAFNSLSRWAQHKQAGEFYPDPLATLDFCRTLTPWVVLRQDYHPRDFTIYMYKKQNA
jgi:SAM-dependent methyltransferase